MAAATRGGQRVGVRFRVEAADVADELPKTLSSLLEVVVSRSKRTGTVNTTKLTTATVTNLQKILDTTVGSTGPDLSRVDARGNWSGAIMPHLQCRIYSAEPIVPQEALSRGSVRPPSWAPI